MPFFTDRVAQSLAEQPVASAARTTSGNSGTLSGYGGASSLRAQLNVTAASGTTPNLVVIIEDSVDGGANWNTIDTFAAKTAPGREVRNIQTPALLFGELLRVSWTITGTTPSFTFAVDWIAQGPQA